MAQNPDVPIPAGANICEGFCGARWAPRYGYHQCYRCLRFQAALAKLRARVKAVGRRTYLLGPTGRTVAVGSLAMLHLQCWYAGLLILMLPTA